jgi:DNA-binding NarL/FixJ family response regulator
MSTYKIIIVENDEDEQFFMKEAFDASVSFELIDQVKNGNLLMARLADVDKPKPDIILSDLNMPGKNGYDILQELKGNADLAHIPVIITSTSSTRNTIEKVMELGAAGYLPKPETFVAYGSFIKDLDRLIKDQQLLPSVREMKF